jgi:hypothetical protein
MKLESKLQYKYYEPGEFVSVEERTLEQVVDLIKQYPWYEQRDATTVDLTCPSITIRNTKGDYLKIGPGYTYFNLYLYASHDKLLTRDNEDLDFVLSTVKDFYNNHEIKGFYREWFLFNVKKHFETNTFEYRVTMKALLTFSSFKTIFYSLITLAPLLVIRFIDYTAIILLIIFLFWLLFAGVNLLLLLNYWHHDRKSVIKITRGQDTFWYGKGNTPKLYNKNDIRTIHTVEPYTTNKNPWAGNDITIITFTSGEMIKFSSLLISSSSIYYKVPDVRHRIIYKTFPFIKSISTR